MRYGNTEFEAIVSPGFPFPLYVREHTGKNPITLVLTHAGALPPI